MTTIGDGLCVIGVALMIFALFSPIWLTAAFEEPDSDYEICLRKCPQTSWRHVYTDLECPKMCAGLLETIEKEWIDCYAQEEIIPGDKYYYVNEGSECKIYLYNETSDMKQNEK